jgi:hypothetical protein
MIPMFERHRKYAPQNERLFWSAAWNLCLNSSRYYFNIVLLYFSVILCIRQCFITCPSTQFVVQIYHKFFSLLHVSTWWGNTQVNYKLKSPISLSANPPPPPWPPSVLTSRHLQNNCFDKFCLIKSTSRIILCCKMLPLFTSEPLNYE